ncbi:hypothetical protein GQ600_9145 [Phytophthora cactorum]|nr:hypothetical protein GQ600_9145 [Phytophthora cactorum]
MSLSKSNDKYNKEVPALLVNGVTPVVMHYIPGLSSAQLTDAARASLDDPENFGQADVPFSDENFSE